MTPHSRPKKVPDNTPMERGPAPSIRAGRLRRVRAPLATEIAITPGEADGNRQRSREADPVRRESGGRSIAVCTVSVLEYVVPTAKFRSEKRETRRAVAVICATPPSIAKSAKRGFGVGHFHAVPLAEQQNVGEREGHGVDEAAESGARGAQVPLQVLLQGRAQVLQEPRRRT